MPYCEIKGELLLSETRINFAADEKNYSHLMVRNVYYYFFYRIFAFYLIKKN